MKSYSAVNSSKRKSGDSAFSHLSAGGSGVALAPPDYGFDFVDHGMSASSTVQRVGRLGSTRSSQANVQSRENPAPATQAQPQPFSKPGQNGLPDNIKPGIEQLSGYSMDGVRVHYNSTKPAQLNALAYTQGHDIYLGKGQERHLPHEAWHVVQQAQGRVRPTLQMKGNVNVNDNPGLEREADMMGNKALQMKASLTMPTAGLIQRMHNTAVVQRVTPPLKSSSEYQQWTSNSGNVTPEWTAYKPTKDVKTKPPYMAFLHSFGNHKGKVDMMNALDTSEDEAKQVGQQYNPTAGHDMKTNSAWLMGLGHYQAPAIMSTVVSYKMLERQSQRRHRVSPISATTPNEIIYKSALTREIEGMTQQGNFVPKKEIIKGRESVSYPNYQYEVEATVLRPTKKAETALLTSYQTQSHGTVKEAAAAVVSGLGGAGENKTTLKKK